MYTQCPGCSTIFRVDDRTLRAKRGEVTCRHCGRTFKAMASREEGPSLGAGPDGGAGHEASGGERLRTGFSLYNGQEPGRNSASENTRYAPGWDEVEGRGNGPELPGSLAWGLGCLLMFALLAWQVKSFEGSRLEQNERLRPWLELFCENFECELSPFRDVRHIQIVDRALHPAPGAVDGYEFSLVLSNQSALAQVFPSLKLVLAELNGRAIATRVFAPEEYLGEDPPVRMPVGKLFEIRLLIAKPSREIGGFSFELI